MALGTFLLVLPLNYLVGRDWIPPDDQGELSAILNLPEGSSLDATVRVSTDLAQKISALKGVEFVNPYVHEGAILSHSHIYVKLVDLGKWLNEENKITEPLRPDHFQEFEKLQPGEDLDNPEGQS